MKKRRVLIGILVVEAILCYVWCAASLAAPAWFTTVFAFPFEQIGLFLRILSLSGGVGNVAAWVFYMGISLVPLGYFVGRVHRTGGMSVKQWLRQHGHELLLPILSTLLFFVLYTMINPIMIPDWLGTWLGTSESGIVLGKSLLGGAVYSVLVSYLVLRMLRIVQTVDHSGLWPYLWGLLAIVAVCFVFQAFGNNTMRLADSVRELYASNTGAIKGLELTLFFLAGQYTVECLPCVLGIQIVFAAMTMLEAFRSELYSKETEEAADRLSYLCGRMLAVTVLSHSIFYLLQLMFASRLRLIRGQVVIPLFAIGVVLAVLLLVQLLRRGRQLKEDNEMFI